MACALCETRRPRRFCPEYGAKFAPPVAARARSHGELSLDCEYLREARKHDKMPLFDPKQIPNRDINVTDQLLSENENSSLFCP